MAKEEINHQAYKDVLDYKEPTMEYNDYYMQCYRFWYNCDPGRFEV